MDLTQELFQSIKLIVEHELSQQKTTSTIIGTVIEKVSSSEAYKVSYQNIEIIASSLGGIYSPGDSVYILLPNGVLGDVKFIVGKTNDRTPTVAKSGNGLSDSTMSMIQNIINSFTEWSSDNSISPIEKASLALQWETIKSSYAEALAQAKEYPEVPVVTLINKYDNLKRLVEPLLSNMGTTSSLNGEELRLALGEYLSEDSAVRLLVQEELKKELVYKTTIVSSEGNSFKNGIIDTTLSTISMRGRKNIDRELESNQIRWTKLDGDGSEEVGSETFGFTREVDSDDVHVKQIFRVEIIIGGIIVAQDYITLVDLNDIENIDLTITIGGSTKQIFNPDTNTIIPDYTKENQVMFARVFKGKEDLSQIADIKWFYNGTPIVSDGRFLVEGYKLTILKNLTNTENPVILIKCSASYYSSEYQMVLEDEEITEFLFISNGSKGETGKDGLPGKDGVGISSTTITYGLSTTDTVEPTKYTSNVPTLVKEQYLWTKTVWKYTDNTTETGYTKTYIAKDGNTGKDGIAGKDGVGISSTEIEYAGSTSGTIKPTSGWNPAVPTVAPGNYLWTKTTWTYTDNTTEPGYTVARMGDTGAPGASATSYWITASNNIIGKSQTGVINPTTITFKGFSKTGTATPVAYSGRFIIQTSTNGTTYTNRYVSNNINESSRTYTIPANTLFVKCLFYMAGGTTVLLDEQTVPIVESAEGAVAAAKSYTDRKIELTDKSIELAVTEVKGYTDTSVQGIEKSVKEYTDAQIKLTSDSITSTVTGVKQTLDSTESTITQQASQIALRATKTELTTAIDGIEIGTRNLLRDSNVEFSFGEDDNKYIWDVYRDNTWEVLGD